MPVFMHCAGYLLSWYRDKPTHGELAKPLRTIDLRELHLLDIGESSVIRLKTSDGIFELTAASDKDAAQWLAHLASAVPLGVQCDESLRVRDAVLAASLASEFGSQPPPRRSIFGSRKELFEAAPRLSSHAPGLEDTERGDEDEAALRLQAANRARQARVHVASVRETTATTAAATTAAEVAVGVAEAKEARAVAEWTAAQAKVEAETAAEAEVAKAAAAAYSLLSPPRNGSAAPAASRPAETHGAGQKEESAAVAVQAAARRKSAERSVAQAKATRQEAASETTAARAHLHAVEAAGGAAEASPFMKCLAPMCKCVGGQK